MMFSGLCLDEITGKFAKYPFKGIVGKDIKEGYKRRI